MPEGDFNAIFSKRLRYYLNERNMTQNELAKRIGVGSTSVYNWCNGIKSPRMDKVDAMCKIFNCRRSDLMEDKLLMSTMYSVNKKEYEHIEKYRLLDSYGKETIDIALTREVERTKLLSEKDARIAELESKPTNVIEFGQYPEKVKERMADYYHSTSAGTGIFIMGNEAVDQIPIPDTPEYSDVDYAINVSGDSMEPEFKDGDTALVSHKTELHYGDIGIFIVDGDAYIKEYGKKGLISHNPKYGVIKISEYNNIVCMGKVIGKL